MKDRTWYFHSKHNHATEQNPVVLEDCPIEPLRVSLMRTGDSIDYSYKEGRLSFFIPELMKAVKVTDVVQVEFGSEFDPNPYLFHHWR